MNKIGKIAIGMGVGIIVGSAIICITKALKKRCEELDYEMFEDEQDEDFDNKKEEEYVVISPKSKDGAEDVNQTIEKDENLETEDAQATV